MSGWIAGMISVIVVNGLWLFVFGDRKSTDWVVCVLVYTVACTLYKTRNNCKSFIYWDWWQLHNTRLHIILFKLNKRLLVNFLPAESEHSLVAATTPGHADNVAPYVSASLASVQSCQIEGFCLPVPGTVKPITVVAHTLGRAVT